MCTCGVCETEREIDRERERSTVVALEFCTFSSSALHQSQSVPYAGVLLLFDCVLSRKFNTHTHTSAERGKLEKHNVHYVYFFFAIQFDSVVIGHRVAPGVGAFSCRSLWSGAANRTWCQLHFFCCVFQWAKHFPATRPRTSNSDNYVALVIAIGWQTVLQRC